MTAPLKVVMVSGVTGGIGRSVVDNLLANGWQVSGSDLAEGYSRELTPSDDPDARFVYCSADAADPGAVTTWLESAQDAYGEVTALVNIAGWFTSAPIEDIAWPEIDQVMRANFSTCIVPCKIVAPVLGARGHGSIVNFASTAGEYGSISPAAHYAAAKGAVLGFSKSLAREVSPHGVRVNVVSPGPVNTTGLTSASVQAADDVARRTLLGRMGRPAEIADAVEYLIGDRSSFVTGHVLRVNGGSLI